MEDLNTKLSNNNSINSIGFIKSFTQILIIDNSLNYILEKQKYI